MWSSRRLITTMTHLVPWPLLALAHSPSFYNSHRDFESSAKSTSFHKICFIFRRSSLVLAWLIMLSLPGRGENLRCYVCGGNSGTPCQGPDIESEDGVRIQDPVQECNDLINNRGCVKQYVNGGEEFVKQNFVLMNLHGRASEPCADKTLYELWFSCSMLLCVPRGDTHPPPLHKSAYLGRSLASKSIFALTLRSVRDLNVISIYSGK